MQHLCFCIQFNIFRYVSGFRCNLVVFYFQKLKAVLQQSLNSATMLNGPSANTMVTTVHQNGGYSFASNSSSPSSSVNSPDNSEFVDDDMDMDMAGSPM